MLGQKVWGRLSKGLYFYFRCQFFFFSQPNYWRLTRHKLPICPGPCVFELKYKKKQNISLLPTFHFEFCDLKSVKAFGIYVWNTFSILIGSLVQAEANFISTWRMDSAMSLFDEVQRHFLATVPHSYFCIM